MLETVQRNTERLHLVLMLTLTFSTGVIDAVGFLGLDRVFTANMTGNVVILAMGFAGADGLPIVGPLIALAGFMVGALIAGRILRPVPSGWTRRTTSLLLVVGLLIGSTAIPALVIFGTLPEFLAFTTTGVLGIAMGMQAAAARHIGVKEVTTVVVTSTITGLAADSWFGARIKQLWFRRICAVILISAGAAIGALSIMVHIGVGIAIAASLTLVVAFLGHIGMPPPASGIDLTPEGATGSGSDSGIPA